MSYENLLARWWEKTGGENGKNWNMGWEWVGVASSSIFVIFPIGIVVFPKQNFHKSTCWQSLN